MTTVAAIRKQLAELTLLIRPPHSLAYRVEKLSAEHRQIYDLYCERMSAFIARNDIDADGNAGNAYAMTLRGYGPQLTRAIATTLFGEMPRLLLIDTTDDDAARKYKEYCDEQR